MNLFCALIVVRLVGILVACGSVSQLSSAGLSLLFSRPIQVSPNLRRCFLGRVEVLV